MSAEVCCAVADCSWLKTLPFWAVTAVRPVSTVPVAAIWPVRKLVCAWLRLAEVSKLPLPPASNVAMSFSDCIRVVPTSEAVRPKLMVWPSATCTDFLLSALVKMEAVEGAAINWLSEAAETGAVSVRPPA